MTDCGIFICESDVQSIKENIKMSFIDGGIEILFINDKFYHCQTIEDSACIVLFEKKIQ